ncbi:MAG: hypothetical protein RIS25_1228 [Actinomycetota bacterium]|jgi:hypothetical protein
MVYSTATTVEQYLAELDEPRRTELTELVSLVRSKLPAGFDEAMAWGMITFQVPLSVSGPTYNKQPLAAIAVASQKNYISFYLSSIYASDELTAEFHERWGRSGKKLNMGKSCIRFTSLNHADLETLGWAASLMNPQQFTQMFVDARRSTRL